MKRIKAKEDLFNKLQELDERKIKITETMLDNEIPPLELPLDLECARNM